MAKIKASIRLDLAAGNGEDVSRFQIGTVDTTGDSVTSKDYKDYVIAVKKDKPTNYILQIGHTTNIPFTYTLYKAKSGTINDNNVVYVGEKETFYYKKGEAVSGDYGGQCMKDYFTAIDEVAKEPYVNKDRLGCVGASFGGFSVYWLAGHHDKRFKAFIAHDGIFNMEMQYLETEEMWFANWDMGGAYWEKQNATAQRTFANSPHKFVDKWDTPILCIHGEKDYRILANQGMAAFNAAVLRGVPAELLIYPDENHWVLKPQNGVLWQRTFFEWLDMWLKK